MSLLWERLSGVHSDLYVVGPVRVATDCTVGPVVAVVGTVGSGCGTAAVVVDVVGCTSLCYYGRQGLEKTN